MKANVRKIINQQIKDELYSAYLYQAMSAWADNQGMKGLSIWMDVQAKEEADHARGLYNYILEQGEKVELQAIDKPPADFASVKAILDATLKHEKFITGKINDIYALAEKEKDYATMSFIKWYIDEQVEEEASANELIDKLKLAGEKGMYLLDQELAQRTYTPTSIVAPENSTE